MIESAITMAETARRCLVNACSPTASFLPRDAESKPRKIYQSLFDRIDFQASSQLQPYKGSLGEVLDELEVATFNPTQHLVTLALHPPRVIRAIIDYKVGSRDSAGVLGLLREAIGLGLGIYQGSPGTPEAITRFRDHVIEIAGDNLLTDTLLQSSDITTWHATSPERSQKTATYIAEMVNRKDILFLALAHGGVAAGMDTYLRYRNLVGSTDSEFYVARHSAHKLHDSEPRLTPEEIQYLQAQVVRRQVVVFDEDRASGETLKKAREFFVTQVFPDQQVTVVTNLDARGELTANGFLAKGEGSQKEHSLIGKIYKEKIIQNLYNPNEKLEKILGNKPIYNNSLNSIGKFGSKYKNKTKKPFSSLYPNLDSLTSLLPTEGVE